MSNYKKFFYDSDKIYETDEDTNANTLAKEILEYEDLQKLDEIVIGCWGESYDNEIQPILDMIEKNKEKFQHIKSFFFGDMTYEECEVSWIEQGNYENLLKALPDLKHLKIKGSVNLVLGNINHQNLESLEIVCGGLPSSVIRQIADAKLPKLKKLNLYLGVEDYGFDASIEDIKYLLNSDVIKNLEYLGIGNSELQNEVVEEFFKLKNIYNIKTLDFSNGTLTDKGANIILDNLELIKKLNKLDLTYHYLSDAMMKKLQSLRLNIILDEQNAPDEYDDEIYYYPMLTE